jgi:hypothetical protein
MDVKKALFIILLFSICLTVFTSDITFASSTNWVEVTRFSDSRAFFGDTNDFTIDHIEWRIKWEFEEGDLRAFFFDIILAETNQTIGSYSNNGNLNITEGIYNITDYDGEFYLFIGTSGGYYSIIIEQNLESLPEFPS